MGQLIINGIDNLNAIIGKSGFKKLFLVVDSSFPFLNIKEDIDSLNIEKVLFSDFTPNPLYEQVCKGVDLFKSEKCDAILAVGGGSSIDVAKCIKLFSILNPSKNYLSQDYQQSNIPLLAIPTTAGTGSESTRNAVIYFEGKKQTVAHDCLTPNYAILEPSVLKTLPLYQKKCTMMDTLCQCIESWWSVNSTDESKDYSRKGIELILSNWHEYIFGVGQQKNIMLAANYGGRAISIAQTTAAHAMSYKITSLYGLPHGHAVAVCLPEIWEFMLGHLQLCIDPRGERYINDIFNEISQLITLKQFREMMNEMELMNPQFQDKDTELEILSTSVNPIRLKNNPVELSLDTIRTLYQKIVS